MSLPHAVNWRQFCGGRKFRPKTDLMLQQYHYLKRPVTCLDSTRTWQTDRRRLHDGIAHAMHSVARQKSV